MNVFYSFFRAELLRDGYTIVAHNGENYWRKPGERGVLYDTAEATSQMLADRKTNVLR